MVTYTEVSRLSFNARILNILIQTLNQLNRGANLSQKDIAIITPYISQETKILEVLGGNYKADAPASRL